MTDKRAIFVSREQVDVAQLYLDDDRDAVLGWLARIVMDYDEAGERPRIRWCAEHGRAYAVCPHDKYTCRVVSAIVCVVEET